jgi:RNA polymerase sigma-70 factor (sigma-E family)
MADEDEFAGFVRASAPRLLWIACLLCNGDRAAAEDLVQDALVETFRRWSRIERPDARFAYARRVLTRTATRRWRSETRILEVTTPDPAPWSKPDDSTDADVGLDVRAALGGLSTKQRAVMVLRYYEDLTEAQIAEALGCSRGSVKKHASRAMAALSDRLDEHNPARTGEEKR